MKEALIMLASLMLISFVIFIQSGVQPEYHEYRGELRIHQLRVELESIEPRAMIYARSQVDRFLASVNGSACVLEPKKPDPNAFREILSEDLSYKGFLSSIELSFEISETGGEGPASEFFGSYCRKGGISVRLSGSASLEDDLTGINGRRGIKSLGCQQTAYYTMRRALNWAESGIREGVKRASRELPNSVEFFRRLNGELRELLISFRESYPELELRLMYDRDFYLEEGELRVLLRFTIVLKDPYGLFIKDGEERKGFWCLRELELVAGRHFP